MDGFMTVKQASEKWMVSVRTVQVWCAEGKIKGVAKMSNIWVIPTEATRPKDRRIRIGIYKNWRSKNNKEREL